VLDSFERVFDYLDLEKKIVHYFKDTAPILAKVELRVGEVRVICGDNKPLRAFIEDKLSVKENVYQIVHSCEQVLYPKMLNKFEQVMPFSDARIKELVIQGFSLEQVHEKEIKKNHRWFTITRFNTKRNTVVYRDGSTGKLFRASLKRPLISCRDSIIRLAGGDHVDKMELYRFITDNSTTIELEGKEWLGINGF
jgi:hypothetical protein